jgi:hypothetical protein
MREGKGKESVTDIFGEQKPAANAAFIQSALPPSTFWVQR